MRVAVIGGGILGASTAFHLAIRNVETVLYEAADQGRATSAGAGIICPWATANDFPDWYRIGCLGARYLPDLVRMLAERGEPVAGYKKSGALIAPEPGTDLAPIEARLRLRRGDAPEIGEITRLSPSEARGLFPVLGEGRAAIHVAGAARLDARLLCEALTRAALGAGARVVSGRARLLAGGGRYSVDAGGMRLEADAVVVTAGIWSNALTADIGLCIAVEPQRGQIIHLGLSGTDTASWPVVLPMNPYYLLAFDDSRVVVGATREKGSGANYRITAAGVAEVLGAGLAVAPGLADATLLETRVGFRPVGPDAGPLLGPARSHAGIYVGNGLGSSGLMIGPVGGRLLAQAVLGDPTDIDLAPYDPLRS